MRLIVVVRPAVAAAANQSAKLVDLVGGERAFTVPLRLAGDGTDAVRAYWCSWELSVAEATALRDHLKAKGLTAAEVAIVPASQRGTFQPQAGARAYVFRADFESGWRPAEVLAALGLDTLSVDH